MHVRRPEGGPGFCSHHKLSRKEKSFSRWFSFWLTSYDEARTRFRILYYLFCKLFVCGYCSIAFLLFVIKLFLLSNFAISYLRIQREITLLKHNLQGKQGSKAFFLYLAVILPYINEAVSSIPQNSYLVPFVKDVSS